ncbi:MAG: hypothetical protein H7X93_14475 [Sphingomonadaceae bacterium]|nr:hypothetical protein [Sphingomonadaceae bacterium]
MVRRVALEIDAIGGRERDIVRYHYQEGLDFTQIGLLMNLTKGRISQLHRTTLALLRKRLRQAGALSLTG